ncbi:hypothetical protein OG2516_14481 [Oceanicola granulosus HTCC2516]|uniref:Uncharacterized protein n=1 Tax=Oceanicola granulosus (strain ATCC BAA-861 / DSM 15982 / KCTC 12143 / HTCC2516) TaxID=314256 RepID=Q2CEY1_OCEGH|nr:hypothetical protein [Oceanicola granulosus]EAR51229.1 hypothetical protein OG2516_14481 [Oceanicola granulosus HTCC2516]
MQRFVLILVLALAASPPALAGAWMREQGAVFLSFGANVALTEAAVRPVHWDPTVFLEYGLHERLTVGLDLYIANGDQEETGTVFARTPLFGAGAGWPVAASLAYGFRNDRLRSEVEQIGRAGLSFGRGLASGWLAADAAQIFVLGEDRRESKLDLTWGHNWTDRLTTVAQLQTGIGTAGDYYAKAAPAVLLQVNERVRLEVGIVQALTGDEGTGLRIATWWEF